MAESWVLVHAPFRDPGLGSEKKANVVWFTRGQPLGFYSSWPMFTLTLHMLVWLSAERVYPRGRFLNYAMLGDDLVIADQATEY